MLFCLIKSQWGKGFEHGVVLVGIDHFGCHRNRNFKSAVFPETNEKATGAKDGSTKKTNNQNKISC